MKIFGLHILTNQKYDDKIKEAFFNGMEDASEIHQKIKFVTINPVIHSLKELRNNTWDLERVDKAIEWLEDFIGCHINQNQ